MFLGLAKDIGQQWKLNKQYQNSQTKQCNQKTDLLHTQKTHAKRSHLYQTKHKNAIENANTNQKTHTLVHTSTNCKNGFRRPVYMLA